MIWLLGTPTFLPASLLVSDIACGAVGVAESPHWAEMSAISWDPWAIAEAQPGEATGAAWESRQPGVNPLQEGRQNLNRLNDQGSMNRGFFFFFIHFAFNR